MIAKVVDKEREYYSYVFAKFYSGFHETVVVYDDENEKFELLRVYDTKWSIKRKVFIIDTDISNFISEREIRLSIKTKLKNCYGYDWIINNKKLIKDIKHAKDVNAKYIDIAKQLNATIDKLEWHYVKNKKDADDLISASWGFHDSYLARISYDIKDPDNVPSSIQILFNGCWECNIILEFEVDVLVHFNRIDNNANFIFNGHIFFEDGYVYWVDEDVNSLSEINNEYIYFRGRSLKWKMITKEE